MKSGLLPPRGRRKEKEEVQSARTQCDGRSHRCGGGHCGVKSLIRLGNWGKARVLPGAGMADP